MLSRMKSHFSYLSQVFCTASHIVEHNVHFRGYVGTANVDVYGGPSQLCAIWSNCYNLQHHTSVYSARAGGIPLQNLWCEYERQDMGLCPRNAGK